ncbi:Mon2p ASCRUDRAFT_68663 [Ascoidea rubescens DSM 1968]|uniref:Endosomal peripheral membrane protein n=1 Tax=Ascoidea rubescens DSM 1968 TaxID=1344418 RepID=A0A1D2VMP3_9ASCO|nr:hypothetical protein ASCRUDRAFT_68663 [Ascoidea rubescens DSM 1968]ODV62854.1 hypothetical protein ASCRUDRAFT_68663 [Ascoidea rubescens DSM 1968]
MATVQLLTSELTNLASESRRRTPEIRHASEKSLEILKSYRPSIQNESDFLQSLSLRPEFFRPFILSCQSRNTKYSAIAVQCLNRLIIEKSLPISLLNDIIDSLTEATHLAIEIQLKILQILPSLFQIYGNYINNELISKLLSICALLQGVNKVPVVINTAAATLQQLIVFIFDKVSDEDLFLKNNPNSIVEKKFDVPIDNNKKIKISSNAYDAQRIFIDLCTLIEHHRPKFLRFTYLPETFNLELIESILTNHTDLFSNHVELAYLVRTRIIPLLLRSFSINKEFPVITRVSRIIYLLIRRNLNILIVETEVIISLLNHILSLDSNSPFWKKILALEIFNGLFTDFNLIKNLFLEYDNKPDRKKVINDFFKTVYQILDSSNSKKLLDFGSILHPPSPSPSSDLSYFLSSKNSLPKVLYIDLLDKADAPHIPDNYIYYLILNCSINFAEGIGRFIMDLSSTPELISYLDASSLIPLQSSEMYRSDSNSTSNSDSHQSKQILYLNSSKLFEKLKDSSIKNDIVFSNKLIFKNYEILLSILKIFLYSNLDNDFFHNLIRSLQKLCYVSGILGLKQTRTDIILVFAIATINNTGKLGYQSPDINSLQSADQKNPANSITSSDDDKKKSFLSLSGTVVGALTQKLNQASSITYNLTPQKPSSNQLLLHTRYMNSRNLITLRALINIAISLGPTLNSSWRIIFVTLQWVNYYINGLSEEFDKNFDNSSLKKTEISASEKSLVENSIKKLLETTKDYSDDSFFGLIKALVSLSNDVLLSGKNDDKVNFELIKDSVYKTSPIEPQNKDVKKITLFPCYYNKIFFFLNIGEITELNSFRFLKGLAVANNKKELSSINMTQKSWNLILNYSIEVASKQTLSIVLRNKISITFNFIIKSLVLCCHTKEDRSVNVDYEKIDEKADTVFLDSLLLFLNKIIQLDQNSKKFNNTELNSVIISEFDMIINSLLNLKELLDKSGSYFKEDSWDIMFKIINLPFKFYFSFDNESETFLRKNPLILEKKSILIKTSFDALQLILNDFLNTLPSNILKTVIDTLFNFINQNYEINISFSAISYFWMVSDYLRDFLQPYKMDRVLQASLENMITNKEELIDTILSKRGEENKLILYSSIWVYLLYILVRICNDERTQVRNGSIQTFFRIIDSHGQYLPSWILIYNIVIYDLLKIRPNDLFLTSNTQERKAITDLKELGANPTDPKLKSSSKSEWTESFMLIINGLVRLYTTFLVEFDEKNLSTLINYWKGLLTYFDNILQLNWDSCNLKVYESIGDLTGAFIDKTDLENDRLPLEIRISLFNFWAKQSISLNYLDNQNYQDTIIALIKSYVPLYKLNESNLNYEMVKQSLMIFNRAVRYPVLPKFSSDNISCTVLQKAIIDNLKLIKSKDALIQSLVILQLASIMILPFSTRRKMEGKLKENKSYNGKIATFIAISYSVLPLLAERISNIEDYSSLIKDKTFIRLFSSCLEPIKFKALGVPVNKNKEYVGRKELWMETIELLGFVTRKAIKVFAPDIENNICPLQVKEDMWSLIIEAVKTCLTSNNNRSDYEIFDIQMYEKFKEIILPYLSFESLNYQLLEELVTSIWKTSFLYSLNDIEKSMISGIGDPIEIATLVSQLEAEKNIGTTENFQLTSRYKISFICLSDLISLSQPTRRQGEEEDFAVRSKRLIGQKCLPYFICRAGLVLRKFIADESLINLSPLPRVQQLELVIVLNGLNSILENHEEVESLHVLYPLIIRCISVTHKVRESEILLEKIFLKLNLRNRKRR